MSKSKYRPHWRRTAPQWFTQVEVTRPRRQAFKRFVRTILRTGELDVFEPQERVPAPWWD